MVFVFFTRHLSLIRRLRGTKYKLAQIHNRMLFLFFPFPCFQTFRLVRLTFILYFPPRHICCYVLNYFLIYCFILLLFTHLDREIRKHPQYATIESHEYILREGRICYNGLSDKMYYGYKTTFAAFKEAERATTAKLRRSQRKGRVCSSAVGRFRSPKFLKNTVV